ncbi:MAG: adenosylcobinamide-GDP ribazoletransferase, partial [Azonexus sp.]
MLRHELEYFFGAIRFFTRLPVPVWVGHSAEALNRSARYFPAVGLLVGGIGALVFLGALQLWPQPVAVLLSMAATIYVTGAFHEDGLSDTVDGLGGGWEKLR